MAVRWYRVAPTRHADRPFIVLLPVLVVAYLLLHRSQSDHLMSKRWSCLCGEVDLTPLYFCPPVACGSTAFLPTSPS